MPSLTIKFKPAFVSNMHVLLSFMPLLLSVHLEPPFASYYCVFKNLYADILSTSNFILHSNVKLN
jgi:hypothetical protein